MKSNGITVNLYGDNFRNNSIAYNIDIKTGERIYPNPIPTFKFSDNKDKLSIDESLTKKLRTMRNLKDLTRYECIEIAKIINPNVNWKFIPAKWGGFNLVDVESPNCDYKNLVQISYNTDKNIFREFDKCLRELNISDRTVYKIILYLQSINVEI